MKGTNILLTGALFSAGFACAKIFEKKSDNPNAVALLEQAACIGIAEIETAKLALQKSLSFEIKNFAQHMIDEHTSINQELISLAKQKNIALADDELVKKSGDLLLQNSESEPFDDAYIEHQLNSHKNAITLFQKITKLEDADVKRFAQATTHRLEHHFNMAKKLSEAIKNKSLIATPSSELGNDRAP